MVNSGWTYEESPFHPGELAVQARLGVQERVDVQGRRMIRDYLTEQHQQFFTKLPYLIVGTVDGDGNPWSSLVVGKPGFIEINSDRRLTITTDILSGDPLASNLKLGVDIGLLGIELPTRRRNRINGVVTKLDRDRFEIQVKQTFGNCPQYIQPRILSIEKLSQQSYIEEIVNLEKSAQNFIAKADTFFIATAYQDIDRKMNTGVDVSHRGGNPGFIKIDSSGTLTIPDFSGNNHFNTIGNLELNPKAGLLFIDFATNDLLYLTGTVEIIWSGEELTTFNNAQRLIRFHLTKGYFSSSSSS